MKPNVFIRARRRGKLIYQWEGHNTWTVSGREYIASMLAYTSFGPDVPVIATSRLKYLQVGVGGNLQGVVPGAIDTGYPVGFDPNASAGNEYNHLYPEAPPIGTLERPVRFSGGTNPYASAAGTDVWTTDPDLPKFLVEFPTSTEVSIRAFLDARNGDIVYGTFTNVPISEAGLVLSGDADVNAAYNPIATYVNFEPFFLMDEVEAELTWLVGF